MTANFDLNRRQIVTALGGLAASSFAFQMTLRAEQTVPRARIGLVSYNCGLRAKWMNLQDPTADLMVPINFLKHCQSLGAGGMQINLGNLPLPEVSALREYAEAHELFIEAIVSPPRNREDLSRFEAEIRTAQQVGALAARTVIIPGRRYEHFKSFEEFQQAERQGQAMVELATPVVEKYQLPLAIENHKDQRIDRRVALLERISSPFVGACIDTGNSLALLDDVYGSIEALAPFAHSVHFKDQALEEYEHGFLLADIPLGQGSLDLARMAQTIRARRPSLRFCLELITREALQVPCLSDSYWQAVTEPSGRELAKLLSYVRSHQAPGQQLKNLSLAEQVALEDANLAASLNYVRMHLPQI